MKPSLLILIPTFNRSDSLIKNLDNLASLASKESRISLNILVGDNCSTDNTARLLMEYSDKFNWINFYVNESNLGITQNIVRGVSDCKEDYLWILGDDDYVSSSIFNQIVTSILASQEMICLWEKRFLDLNLAMNFISKNSPCKKIHKSIFSKIALKWRRKIAIKSGFISSFIFKTDLYLDGFLKFKNIISYENNYFLRACILNAVGRAKGVSVFIPGIAVMRQKGAESHFVSEGAIKTFLFDDFDVAIIIIQEKMLRGVTLWFYVYDFFRTRSGLIFMYGLKKYESHIINANLEKKDLLIVKSAFFVFKLKIFKCI